jgi:hypothetical protein
MLRMTNQHFTHGSFRKAWCVKNVNECSENNVFSEKGNMVLTLAPWDEVASRGLTDSPPPSSSQPSDSVRTLVSWTPRHIGTPSAGNTKYIDEGTRKHSWWYTWWWLPHLTVIGILPRETTSVTFNGIGEDREGNSRGTQSVSGKGGSRQCTVENYIVTTQLVQRDIIKETRWEVLPVM